MPSRRLRFFATAWSLRQYPTAKREWSWARKFRSLTEAGFDGVMSPPRPELAERGALAYLAITSIDRHEQIQPSLAAARALGAEAVIVQLSDYDTPLAAAAELAAAILAAGRALGLPVDIETHRDTFTETPENTRALARAVEQLTGQPLPLCFDFSHYAVVRHLNAPYWARLSEDAEAIARARTFHLRPFNGHHAQIPVTRAGRGRAPEYRLWREFAQQLFRHLHTSGARDVIVVPELGHANPAYGLSCFPDTWTDLLALHRDLRALWRQVSR